MIKSLSDFRPIYFLLFLVVSLQTPVVVESAEHLKASNISATSATVSWLTAYKGSAQVNYGLTTQLGQTAQDSRQAFVHWVELTNLTADTEYHFELVVDQISDDNQGQYYNFRTAQFGIGVPFTLYGRLTQGQAAQPVVGALAEVTLVQPQVASSYLTMLTDANGFWQVNLGNLKNAWTGSILGYQAGDQVRVSIRASEFQSWQQEFSLAASSPQKIGVESTSSVTVEQVTIALSAGWNMISLPGHPLDTNPASLQGENTQLILPLYRWDPAQFTYRAVEELQAGEGYWALSLNPEGAVLETEVIAISKYQASLKPGWNMIGGVNQSADFSSPADEPDDSIVPNTLYRWQADSFTYLPAQSIEPGRGYWVLTLTPCLLTIDAAAVFTAPMAGAKPINWQLPIRLRSDRQERIVWLGLDQKASEGIDDLDRFVPPTSLAELSLEAYLVGGQYRFRRDVRAISDEQVSWQMRVSSPDPVQLTVGSQWVPTGQELVIIDRQMETIVGAGMEMELDSGDREVTFSLRPLPKAIQLLQNYPNPFNPETWIPYQLNRASEVSVSVYSSEGKLVKQIDLGLKPAGNYQTTERSIHWDGRNANGESVSSGVYFYRLQAGDYSQTRKMVILK
jgi:hypothetical protein